MCRNQGAWCALVSALLLLPALAANEGVRVGQTFPNFTATDISGKKLTLKDFRGRVVLVDFWATWCGPCRRELPFVKQAHERYRERGFEIISVSLDHTLAKCKPFIQQNGMDWHHVVEGGGWKTRLAVKYGIRSIPQTFLLDPEGVVIGRPRGQALLTEVESALDKAGLTVESAAAAKQAKPKRDRAAKEEASESGESAEPNENAEKAVEESVAEAQERTAQNLLSMARSMVERHPSKARGYYEALLKQFPDTNAAAEAKAELEKLPK